MAGRQGGRYNLWVQGGLVEKGTDDSNLESRRDTAEMKGKVHNFGVERTESGDM